MRRVLHEPATLKGAETKERQNDFPKAFFLDSDFCRLSGLEIPNPHVLIPTEIANLVGDFAELWAIALKFF